MKRRIESLIRRNELNSFDEYFRLLKRSDRHLNEFLDYITINVSEFFRNPSQWQTLEKEILPKVMSNKMRLRVWSSASASGEEPYSLAIMFNEMGIKNAHILATDIDVKAIERAKMGVYSSKSLANLPQDQIDRYFGKDKEQYIISDIIKQGVEFKRLDLLEDNFPTKMDLILCRNVMIYFTEEAKGRLYHKFHKALDDKGIFFVGSTEQIIVPYEYGFTSVKSFFYQKT